MTLYNHNADSHAMHLHGHSFQVIEMDKQPINGPMRDTVLMPKGGCRRVRVCFDTNNPGVWPFHCHMNYHLAAGMLTTLEYGVNNKVQPLPGTPTPAPRAAAGPTSEWNALTKALLATTIIAVVVASVAAYAALSFKQKLEAGGNLQKTDLGAALLDNRAL